MELACEHNKNRGPFLSFTTLLLVLYNNSIWLCSTFFPLPFKISTVVVQQKPQKSNAIFSVKGRCGTINPIWKGESLFRRQEEEVDEENKLQLETSTRGPGPDIYCTLMMMMRKARSRMYFLPQSDHEERPKNIDDNSNTNNAAAEASFPSQISAIYGGAQNHMIVIIITIDINSPF